MGEEWRIPTLDENFELVENTDHYYIGEDGSVVAESELSNFKKLRSICFAKKGEEFNYDNRSNFIEFPFAGFCNNNSLGGLDGFYGYVWSRSVAVGYAAVAHHLGFNDDGSIGGNHSVNCSYGLSVRGVKNS